MTAHIILELESLIARFKANPTVEKVETEVEAIGKSALDYIKHNGLTALYTIAQSALLGVTAGTPYVTLLASVVTQGEAAGIQIAKGAEAIVVAQAQADLIAAGKLIAPSTTALVAS